MSEGFRPIGKWSQPSVPHRGWTCVGIEDLEEPSAVCEMCENQEIRYVHHMMHPDYPDELACGCVCAGRMEEDYEGARRRESALRASTGRKRRWLERRWRKSSRGNPYINADGYNVVVYPKRSPGNLQSWGFRVSNTLTGDAVLSRKPYPTEDAAKLRAFDAIVWTKDRGR